MSRLSRTAANVPRLAPAIGLALVVLLLGAVFTLSMPDDKLWQRVVEDAGARPGLQLLEPPADWSGFEQIVFDVSNPAPRPVSIVLRILDATHDWTFADRFKQVLPLPARTRTVVRISLEAVAASPRGRRMDMTAIANVMLFTRRPVEDGELYITRVWLE